MRRISSFIAACASIVLLAACGSEAPAGDESSSAEGGGSITVLAAASLQEVFEEMAPSFTEETGTEVTFSFAGSSTLVTQLSEGAPADVLATANEKTMNDAVAAETVAEPTLFATNTLTLAVAPGNPKNVTGLQDLSNPDLLFVRCASAVPCGSASDTVLEGTEATPVSEENSVTDVLGKVTSGQADVGLVYTTDITRADGDAEAVDFPEASEAVNKYPIATTSEAAPEAQAFVDHVTGSAGQEVLSEAGFGAPQ